MFTMQANVDVSVRYRSFMDSDRWFDEHCGGVAATALAAAVQRFGLRFAFQRVISPFASSTSITAW